MTKRLLIAAVIGLLAAGCAEGIDDPQPGPDRTASNSAGAAQQDSAELPDTRIDPTALGGGLSAPKENVMYENPNAHPGWVRPAALAITLEQTVAVAEAEQADVTFDVVTSDLGPDNVQKKH